MHPHHVLVTVTGFDRPGVTSALFAALAAHDVEVLDVEQVVVRGRVVLGAALTLHGDPAALRRAATHAAEALGVDVDVSLAADIEDTSPPEQARHRVVVLGQPLRAGAVGLVARCVTDLGGNIESMSRVASVPVTALELVISGVDHHLLCATLVTAAAETGTDIAVERSELHRLAKRLVLVDVDSTLLHGDPFALLAERARGVADRGESPLARAAALAGLPETAFDEVRGNVRLDPDTPRLASALTRLGFRCGAVSSAPAQVIEPLLDTTGLDLVAANRLEVVRGELTGRLVGPPVDRLGKARALLRFADAYGVPASQSVAVASDGEVDVLAVAGLGVALHSEAGDEQPGRNRALDGLLLMLGVARADVEEMPGAVPLLTAPATTAPNWAS